MGWSKFWVRPWYLFTFTLGYVVLFVLAGASNSLFTALAYILYSGFLAVLFLHYNGSTISFDDLFASLDNRWISLAFTAMVKALLVMVGLVFFIVPGIYLAIKWMFAELLVIDQGMKPMQALRASSEMTKGHRWKLFWFCIVGLFIILLGVIALGVGVVVSSLVLSFALIKIYYDLKK